MHEREQVLVAEIEDKTGDITATNLRTGRGHSKIFYLYRKIWKTNFVLVNFSKELYKNKLIDILPVQALRHPLEKKILLTRNPRRYRIIQRMSYTKISGIVHKTI